MAAASQSSVAVAFTWRLCVLTRAFSPAPARSSSVARPADADATRLAHTRELTAQVPCCPQLIPHHFVRQFSRPHFSLLSLSLGFCRLSAEAIKPDATAIPCPLANNRVHTAHTCSKNALHRVILFRPDV